MANQDYDGRYAPKIEWVLTHLGLTIYGLADAVGRLPGAMRNYKIGKTEPPMGLYRDIKILIPGLSDDWWFLDVEPILRENTPDQQRENKLLSTISDLHQKIEQCTEREQSYRGMTNKLVIAQSRLRDLLSESIMELSVLPDAIEQEAG